MCQNPFDPQFGQVPKLFLDYDYQARSMVSRMKSSNVGQAWFITGLRGSGKTVLLNYFGTLIDKEPGYFVVRTNNDSHLFERLYRSLVPVVSSWHLDSVSLGGLHFSHDVPVNELDYEAALTRFFSSLKVSTNYRIVILLDEAGKSEYMRSFSNAFRDWNSGGLPVSVVMTGLLKEVTDLSEDENLTFLLRATRFLMKPLLAQSIKDVYVKYFHDDQLARKMTMMTMGYPFAFQLLGYEMWEASQNSIDHDVLDNVVHHYKNRLFTQAYLENVKSMRGRTFDYLVAVKNCDGRTGDIAKSLGVSPQSGNNLRARLIRYGLIRPNGFGKVAFTLPYFGDFVSDPTGYGLNDDVYAFDDRMKQHVFVLKETLKAELSLLILFDLEKELSIGDQTALFSIVKYRGGTAQLPTS